MSPTSYQLLYPAILDCKDTNNFLFCKFFFKICKNGNRFIDKIPVFVNPS